MRALVRPDGRLVAKRSSTTIAPEHCPDCSEQHRGLPDRISIGWQRWLDRNWVASVRSALASAPDEDAGEDALTAMVEYDLMRAAFAVPDEQVRHAVTLDRGMQTATAEDFTTAWVAITT